MKIVKITKCCLTKSIAFERNWDQFYKEIFWCKDLKASSVVNKKYICNLGNGPVFWSLYQKLLKNLYEN